MKVTIAALNRMWLRSKADNNKVVTVFVSRSIYKELKGGLMVRRLNKTSGNYKVICKR